MTLLESINMLANDNLDTDNGWYTWKINESKLPQGLNLSEKGNYYQKNIELKELLNNYASKSQQHKTTAIKYYISDWGGVRGNSQDTIVKYCESEPSYLISMGVKGIASWSKALCVIDPKKYAIFDARVSVALNCLQLINKVEVKKSFPILASQNKKIIKANSEFKKLFRTDSAWEKPREHKFYDDYLNLIKEASTQHNTSIATIEMLLFSKAEELIDAANI